MNSQDSAVDFSGALVPQDVTSVERPNFLILFLCFVLCVFLFKVADNDITSDISFMEIFVALAAALLLAGVFYLAFIYYKQRRWRQNRILGENIAGTVSGDGLKWNLGGKVRADIPWASLTKAKITPAAVMIRGGPDDAYLIPRRFVRSDAEWEQLCGIVASGCGKQKRKNA